MYSKIFLQLSVKGFPYGKIYNFYFWSSGKYKLMDIDPDNIRIDFIVGSGINLSESDIFKRFILKINYFDELPKDEKLNHLVFVSKHNISNTNKISETEVDVNAIDLSSIKKDDLEEFKNKISQECLRRENFLNDKEFEFFKINKGLIDINQVKDIYPKYKNDFYKLRKNIIKEKIKNLL